MSTEVKGNSNGLHGNMIAGGWEPYLTSIDKDASKVFKEALKDLLGVEYTPLAVATQVVSGINYSFFCNAKRVGSGYNEAVMILIYVDVTGKVANPVITPVHNR